MIIQPEGNLLRTTRISGRQVQEVLRGRKRRRFVRGGSSSSSSESISSSESLSESLSDSGSASFSSSSSSSGSSSSVAYIDAGTCCYVLPKRWSLTASNFQEPYPAHCSKPFFNGSFTCVYGGSSYEAGSYPAGETVIAQWRSQELFTQPAHGDVFQRCINNTTPSAKTYHLWAVYLVRNRSTGQCFFAAATPEYPYLYLSSFWTEQAVVATPTLDIWTDYRNCLYPVDLTRRLANPQASSVRVELAPA